jgi:hypothetical protein
MFKKLPIAQLLFAVAFLRQWVGKKNSKDFAALRHGRMKIVPLHAKKMPPSGWKAAPI